ncbi:family 10 glycosylhydrolase, partial [Candidatus Sumerlaeota bacterium]|nr:family 10 glycosylhydrolase [Candidatus Sumerlaeota bacterium]
MKKIMRSLFVFMILSCASFVAAETIIIDNLSAEFAVSGNWDTGSSAGYHVTDYRHINTELTESAYATFSPSFASGGTYEVFTWYVEGTNRPTDAKYVITHKNGSSAVYVNQTTNGKQWYSIGSYEFNATGGEIKISNESSVAGKAVIADAVKFVRSGTSYVDLYQADWIYGWGADYGFYSASDTDNTMTHARQNNINCIFPEVRKVGDAHYISATEPRASNIDPSYADPLADVITKAHDTSGGKQYIEVHAWIVPYRVWSGSGSKPVGHVLLEHPKWEGEQYDGTKTGNYLDPGHPEVLDYMVDVVMEIIRNYDVDGIHWDYFRYESPQWGYNPTAVDRFNALYGKSGKPATNDPDFCEFRRNQIKDVARKVYANVKAEKWDCKMSGALITWLPSPPGGDFTATRPYYDVFQDWPAMISEGSLDLLVPMNYMRDHDVNQKAGFRGWTDFTAGARAGRHAIIGPGSYLNYIHNSITQMLYAIDTPGICGVNVYRYLDTFYGSGTENDFWYTVKADIYNQRRNVPDAPWLSSPTQGILKGTVTSDGTNEIDGATLTLSGGASGTIKTDGSGFYAFLKLNPGTGLTATASATGYTDKAKSFDISAGVVTTLDFNMNEPTPTETPTPTPTETPTPTPTPTPT